MDLHNTFEVPLPPDQAWKVLLDIARIAPCMPGAELTEVVNDKTFKGKCGVKLGPVALAFNGVATFEEIDAAAYRAMVKAQGTDTRGRGGASANVTFRLEPVAVGSSPRSSSEPIALTRVLVDTKLDLSGSVAQYGRGTGMIQSVASQLIGQFAKNLEAELRRTPAPMAAENAVISTGDSMRPAAPAAAAVTGAVPPRAPAKPISGFALLWAAFVDVLRGLFGARKGS